MKAMKAMKAKAMTAMKALNKKPTSKVTKAMKKEPATKVTQAIQKKPGTKVTQAMKAVPKNQARRIQEPAARFVPEPDWAATMNLFGVPVLGGEDTGEAEVVQMVNGEGVCNFSISRDSSVAGTLIYLALLRPQRLGSGVRFRFKSLV